VSAYNLEERCGCGALFSASGNYLATGEALLWRVEHKHIEPLVGVRPRIRMPRPRLRVRRMPTVPRRLAPVSGEGDR
jgi:hypothetical protein